MESGGSSADDEPTFHSQHCSAPAYAFLAEVDAEYVADSFNLTGLRQQVPHYREALALLVAQPPPPQPPAHELAAARLLYGLIHARWLATARGLTALAALHGEARFGACPRALCCGARALPWGAGALPGGGAVQLFCPRCEELYDLPPGHRAARLDGAFFGPSAAHALLLQHPALRGAKDEAAYVPRLMGFRVAGQLGRPSLAAGQRQQLAAGSGAGSGGEGGGGASASGSGSGSGGASASASGGGGGAAGAAAGRARRPEELTTHYTGARPLEDDFFTEEDTLSPSAKRKRQ